jgi:hypothetical protein
LFRRVLDQNIELLQDRPPERRLLFLKSWNEWAEGNHLEPDLKFGTAFLQVIADALGATARETIPMPPRVVDTAGGFANGASGQTHAGLDTPTEQSHRGDAKSARRPHVPPVLAEAAFQEPGSRVPPEPSA